jgi:D(-)-tartrate dehydratase
MKVGAPLTEDCRRIEAVLEIVGEGKRLAVNANGRFDLPAAIEFAKAISGYGLK